MLQLPFGCLCHFLLLRDRLFLLAQLFLVFPLGGFRVLDLAVELAGNQILFPLNLSQLLVELANLLLMLGTEYLESFFSLLGLFFFLLSLLLEVVLEALDLSVLFDDLLLFARKVFVSSVSFSLKDDDSFLQALVGHFTALKLLLSRFEALLGGELLLLESLLFLLECPLSLLGILDLECLQFYLVFELGGFIIMLSLLIVCDLLLIVCDLLDVR